MMETVSFLHRYLAGVLAVLAAAAAVPALAQSDKSADAGTAREVREVPQNLFNDPFEQLSRELPHCPEPLGPRLPESQRSAVAHNRIERGTTCWLAGRCRLAHSTDYDPEIAQALLPKLKASPALRGTSLWVYFFARNVYLQGCAGDPAQVDALAAIAREHPDVFTVVPTVRTDARQPLPYEPMPQAAGQ